MEVRELIDELVKAWNAHDAERLAGCFCADYQGADVVEPATHSGPEGARACSQRYFRAFPDIELTVERVLVDDHEATVLWRACGFHEGVFMNIPPTGRKVTISGVSIFDVREGKVYRGRYIWDVAGFLREIRLLPELT